MLPPLPGKTPRFLGKRGIFLFGAAVLAGTGVAKRAFGHHQRFRLQSVRLCNKGRITPRIWESIVMIKSRILLVGLLAAAGTGLSACATDGYYGGGYGG